jgi:hypothetical protein
MEIVMASTPEEVSEQISALMIIVGALAKKSGIAAPEVVKFAEHATQILPEPQKTAVRKRVATLAQTYTQVA